ncbi:very short patch repair endonuclease [Spiribacter onubensis]|uniref:very short patch repair endonuclease n=1 Tax=Spiribacter onubensis TaxID=3122420 RepID=UPI0038B4C08B
MVDRDTRSRMMSGIRGKDTKPELMIRKALHARSDPFRLHAPAVPSKPDLFLRRYRATIYVHGCFWHGHECHLFKLPSTRTEFWQQKIDRNRTRDAEVEAALRDQGWRRFVISEGALKGKTRLEFENLMNRLCQRLAAGGETGEIAGSVV